MQILLEIVEHMKLLDYNGFQSEAELNTLKVVEVKKE